MHTVNYKMSLIKRPNNQLYHFYRTKKEIENDRLFYQTNGQSTQAINPLLHTLSPKRVYFYCQKAFDQTDKDFFKRNRKFMPYLYWLGTENVFILSQMQSTLENLRRAMDRHHWDYMSVNLELIQKLNKLIDQRTCEIKNDKHMIFYILYAMYVILPYY